MWQVFVKIPSLMWKLGNAILPQKPLNREYNYNLAPHLHLLLFHNTDSVKSLWQKSGINSSINPHRMSHNGLDKMFVKQYMASECNIPCQQDYLHCGRSGRAKLALIVAVNQRKLSRFLLLISGVSEETIAWSVLGWSWDKVAKTNLSFYCLIRDSVHKIEVNVIWVRENATKHWDCSSLEISMHGFKITWSMIAPFSFHHYTLCVSSKHYCVFVWFVMKWTGIFFDILYIS